MFSGLISHYNCNTMSLSEIYELIDTTSEWERSWEHGNKVKKSLKELNVIIYTNNMHLFFQWLNIRETSKLSLLSFEQFSYDACECCH